MDELIRCWNAGEYDEFTRIIQRLRQLEYTPAPRDRRDENDLDYAEEAQAQGVNVADLLRMKEQSGTL